MLVRARVIPYEKPVSDARYSPALAPSSFIPLTALLIYYGYFVPVDVTFISLESAATPGNKYKCDALSPTANIFLKSVNTYCFHRIFANVIRVCENLEKIR